MCVCRCPALITKEFPQVWQILDVAQNPAAFARNFLENEVKTKYFNQPYKAGGLVFKIEQQDFKKSLFSPDANISVVITYPAADLTVKAKGMYFKYNGDSCPSRCSPARWRSPASMPWSTRA